MAILLKAHAALPSWNIFDLDKGEGGDKKEKIIAALYTENNYQIKVNDYPLNTKFFIYKNDEYQGSFPHLSLAMVKVEADALGIGD